MAVPKKKSSPMRIGHRNSHSRIKERAISYCDNCGSHRIPHNACTACGFYKGRQIFVPSKIRKQNKKDTTNDNTTNNII